MPARDDKEEKIITAAISLFARRGLKTTVDEIVEAAGVGKGTVYLYFESKEEVFAAGMRREANLLLQKVRSAVRKESSAVEQLRCFVRTRFRGIEDMVVLHQVSDDILRELKPGIDRIYDEFNQVERAFVEDILEGGVERGEMVLDDIPMASLAITAALRALEVPWLYEGRELRLDKKVDVLVDLFVHGLTTAKRTTTT